MFRYGMDRNEDANSVGSVRLRLPIPDLGGGQRGTAQACAANHLDLHARDIA